MADSSSTIVYFDSPIQPFNQDAPLRGHVDGKISSEPPPRSLLLA